MLTTRAAANTRGATLLPLTVKEGNTEKAKAVYFVFGRDVILGDEKVSMMLYTKQTKLKKSLVITQVDYPKSTGCFEELRFVGPYWAAVALDSVMCRYERDNLLRASVGTRRRWMVRGDMNAWLEDLAADLPRVKEIVMSTPGFKLNPSTLRAQFTTSYQRISKNADELMKLTRHSSAAMALEHYTKMSEGESVDLKLRCLDHFNTVWAL